MRARNWVALIFAWLACTMFSLMGVWVAVENHRSIGWIGVMASGVVAVCAIVGVPLIAGLNSSGEWYTITSLQPALDITENELAWTVSARNDVLRAAVLAPIGICLGVLAVAGVFANDRRGWMMPGIGALLLFFTAWFVVKVLSTRTSAQLRNGEFIYRTREAPFLEREQRVHPVRRTSFWEVAEPIPVGCKLRLHGSAETTWFWRGKPFNTSKSRELTVPVPYFSNAAPVQVEKLISERAARLVG